MMYLLLGELIATGAIFWFAGAVTSPMKLPLTIRALSALACLAFTYLMVICAAKMGANELVLGAVPWGCLALGLWGCAHAWRTDIEDLQYQAAERAAYSTDSVATLH